MPYIPQDRRRVLSAPAYPESSGELSYMIADAINAYLEDHGHSWQTFSDVFGAVEGAVGEFRRKVVEPYEDGKMMANGRIF